MNVMSKYIKNILCALQKWIAHFGFVDISTRLAATEKI